jgi:hypothetical protein
VVDVVRLFPALYRRIDDRMAMSPPIMMPALSTARARGDRPWIKQLSAFCHAGLGTLDRYLQPTLIRLVGVSAAEFQVICDNGLAEIDRWRRRYLGDRARVEITGPSPSSSTMGGALGA